MPSSLLGYIWRVSGHHQIWLSLFSIAVFLLTMVPLELQRRIVNVAVEHHEFRMLTLLCLGYIAVVLVQGGLKLVLNIYRGTVGEAATRDLRLRTHPATSDLPPPQAGAQHEGLQVSIIVSEVEPVGGFVAVSFSEPLLHAGILASVFGYMLFLQPWLAVVCIGVFTPQLVFVPLMQRAINRRTKSRIKILRAVSIEIVGGGDEPAAAAATDLQRQSTRIYRLNVQIFRLKFTMNFLMNFMHHLAIVSILFVGGWFVIDGKTEIGTVVAFISGLDRVIDPWGDLVNYFQEMTSARIKYGLIAKALGQAPIAATTSPPAEAVP